MDQQLQQYLMGLTDTKPDWVRKLESLAKEEDVPIMEPLGMEYVRQLIRIKQPKKILEIGTAIGYSALMMEDAFPKTEIVTIERDEKRYQQALKHIKERDKQESIHVIYGDALELASEAEQKGPYDFLFIDAAKGQYQRFFEIYTALLSKDGIIVSDNVLFKGLVAGGQQTEQNRRSGIAGKLRNYNEWLNRHPDYHTTVVPIGDGVAVSVKKHRTGKRS